LLSDKYAPRSGRIQTWGDSYHGFKSRAGDTTVATCYSCHGAHKILPHTDPDSSIFPTNLAKTCGNCHPGISAALASNPIHQPPGISRTPMARTIASVYAVAIAIIITLMILHWLLDLRKKMQILNQQPQIVRMNRNELSQHIALMISFSVLAITGFSLRFSDAFFVQFLFGWEGGFLVRGTIHSVAAVLFILTITWHLIYLFSKRGRQFLVDIAPRINDFYQLILTVSYYLNLRKEKPLYGRFGYVEKIEYWGLVLGSTIMTVSGVSLWFDNLFIQWFSGGFLDVMLIFHYYEAWLAVLTIVVWHLYSTVFRPRTYPMNPAWLTGKIPRKMYQSEHQDESTED